VEPDTELPCPYCRATISLKLSDFYPGRWWVFCPSCKQASRFPTFARFMGVLATCLVFTVEIGLLKILRVPRPDTFPGIALAAGGILLMVFSAMPFANRACRMFVTELRRR